MNDITTRDDIINFVNVFYKKVNEDIILAPVFNKAMKTDWEKHLPKMYDFWETVLLYHPIYKENMVQKHIEVDHKVSLTDEMFEHWVKHFTTTIDDLYVGEVAERAKQIAATNVPIMKAKLAWYRNERSQLNLD